MLDEHGLDMSAKDKKDTRRVEAKFEFEEVGAGRRGRNREPPPQAQQPGPSRVAPAPQNRRREGFGASLTAQDGSGPNSQSATPARRLTPSPQRADVDPLTAESVILCSF
jgi:hypothetical protein